MKNLKNALLGQTFGNGIDKPILGGFIFISILEIIFIVKLIDLL
jgi:hypothetical protein